MINHADKNMRITLLFQDLTSSLAGMSMETPPAAPSHHEPARPARKADPPARPPPPTVTPTAAPPPSSAPQVNKQMLYASLVREGVTKNLTSQLTGVSPPKKSSFYDLP